MKNTVQLIGDLGNDPETREFPNGNRLTIISVATTERFKGANNEWKEDTQWHRVVAWGRQAERLAQTLRKGSRIALQGRLVHRAYDGKDGQRKYMTEVVLSDFQAMGTKPGADRADRAKEARWSARRNEERAEIPAAPKPPITV